jgi:hypothetical protein
LKEEAQNRDQQSAVFLIRSRSRYIANDIRERIAPLKDQMTYNTLQQEHDRLNHLKKVEKYLEESNTDIGGPSRQLDRSVETETESSDNDDNTDFQGYERYPVFAGVKDFIFNSRAFVLFRHSLNDFVQPTLTTKLNRLIEHMSELGGLEGDRTTPLPPSSTAKLRRLVMELDCTPPNQIHIMYEDNIGVLDGIKNFLESITGTSWNWWPLDRSLTSLSPGHARITWLCVCPVPVTFLGRTRTLTYFLFRHAEKKDAKKCHCLLQNS